MSFSEFMNKLMKDEVEGEIVKTVFYSLFTSLIVFGILYYLKLRNISGFMDKYGFFLFFSFLSYSLIIAVIRQVRAFKEFPCMSGMMIGMTLGMIAGFLSGYFVGATNGMFYGSVFGMVIGIIVGGINGRCCGIMGIMEGIMAGFMGGIMGAMTAVMMINDNLKLAGLVVFIVSAVIMIGLNYMVYKETRQMERQRNEDSFITIVLSFILTIVTIWLMVFGPRSILFQ